MREERIRDEKRRGGGEEGNALVDGCRSHTLSPPPKGGRKGVGQP